MALKSRSLVHTQHCPIIDSKVNYQAQIKLIEHYTHALIRYKNKGCGGTHLHGYSQAVVFEMYNDHQKTRRVFLKAESKYNNEPAKEQEMRAKFTEMMSRKQKRVEKRYAGSVANQLYIFPRSQDPNSQDEQQDESGEINWQRYDLASQNRKDTSHQVCTQSIMMRSSSALGVQSVAHNTSHKKRAVLSQRSKREGKDECQSCRDDSYQKQSVIFKRDKSKRKGEVNISSYSSRRGNESSYHSRKGDTSHYQSRKAKKDGSGQRTLMNSSKKLIKGQYSIGTNSQAHTKKGSETIIVSFRGRKGDPPRQPRMHTDAR